MYSWDSLNVMVRSSIKILSFSAIVMCGCTSSVFIEATFILPCPNFVVNQDPNEEICNENSCPGLNWDSPSSGSI